MSARIFIACCSVGIPIDIPIPLLMMKVRRETKLAQEIGMLSKSTVNAGHCKIINDIFSPEDEEVEAAKEIVAIFEKAMSSVMLHNSTKIEPLTI